MTQVAGGLVHRLLSFDDVETLVNGAVPFLLEGVDRGQYTCAVVTPEHRASIRERLGAAADEVEWMDADSFFTRPADTCTAYHDLVEERGLRGGGSARVLAEGVWIGRDDDEIVEWLRFEAAVNEVFASVPLDVMCCYDRRRARGWATAVGRGAHPVELTADGFSRCGAYDSPGRLVEALQARRTLTAPPAEAAVFAFENDLQAVRAFVRREASSLGCAVADIDDVILVVNELASNVVEHARAPGSATIWLEGNALACEVRHANGAEVPALAGYDRPAATAARGRGWVLVRTLADQVDILNGQHGQPGTAVRVKFQ